MTFEHSDFRIVLNGKEARLPGHPLQRLSDGLRSAGHTSVKVGCDAGDCGACTVLLNGEPVCACLTPMAAVDGMSVHIVEAEEIDQLRSSFLRHGAAQCGICTPGMLVAAAALRRENPTPDRAEAEAAIGGVLCRCTGYTKIIDAICDTQTDVPHDPACGGVGTRMERLDGGPKVDGSEAFGADFAPEGSYVVQAIRSPHAHAAFDINRLKDWAISNGVQAITAEDVAGRNRFGVIPAFADQPVLASQRARFRGEAVALLVGPADAMNAVASMQAPVNWTPLAAAEGMDAAKAPQSHQVHEERADNLLIAGRVVSGDAGAALTRAAHFVEGSMTTGFVEHAYVEPEAGAAWMEGEILVIRACTQAPVMDRDETAAVLGLDQDRVRIIPAATGGGFGSKLDLSVQPLLGLAVLATGRPCKMTYTRRESMQSTTKRHPGRMAAKIGADAEGRICGFAFDGDFDTGAYASWGPTVANRVPVHASGPYLTPDYTAEARAIHTNGPVAGAFRGFGVPQAALLQETLYDQLADACGMDRLAFRQVNALRDGAATPCGQTLFGVGIRACLDTLEPHWDAALDWTAQSSTMLRGVGVASCWYGCGNTSLPNPSTIRAGIAPDGRILLHQGAVDIGQGSNTVIAQIFAEALGVATREVSLVGADTALTPDCGKTSASRQTYVTGRAAEAAGRALRTAILRQANAEREAEFRIENGRIHVSDARTLVLADMPLDGFGYVLSAEESYDPPTTALDENGQGKPYAVYGYGAQMAQVEVDPELGKVFVRHMVAAHDLGRTINPTLAEGQIQGGIAQGIGLALMEEYVPGKTEDLHNYLIPTSGDMPTIETILLEVPDPEGPMGAKGLGEHALIPTAPAILNAIRHATGAALTRVPALPHRVLAAMKEAQNG